MARVGHQLLTFSHDIEDGRRKDFMRRASSLMASWIVTNIRSTDNGWWPRYCAIDGSWTREDDEFFDYSADGLFIIDLLTDLVRGGDEQYRPLVIEKAATFLESGGLFASINHDTFDRQECVSYAVAFRTLRRVADLVGDDELRRFAYDTALAGLARFRLTEDHNGVATKGLLYMEDSWDTSYLWENAHSALAYFEAASECEEYRREYSLAGLTILRAISRHHYGDLVFLTEGIDWNNHVGAQHHFGDETYGAIQYTEPLLNNLHIVAPTLYYLENLATQRTDANRVDFVDCDDNVLTSRDRL